MRKSDVLRSAKSSGNFDVVSLLKTSVYFVVATKENLLASLRGIKTNDFTWRCDTCRALPGAICLKCYNL